MPILIRSGVILLRTASKRRIDLIERIGRVFEMLVQNPYAGRQRPELAEGLRSFAVANHVIFYFAQSDGVEIVRVMSGRRDITSDDMD